MSTTDGPRTITQYESYAMPCYVVHGRILPVGPLEAFPIYSQFMINPLKRLLPTSIGGRRQTLRAPSVSATVAANAQTALWATEPLLQLSRRLNFHKRYVLQRFWPKCHLIWYKAPYQFWAFYVSSYIGKVYRKNSPMFLTLNKQTLCLLFISCSVRFNTSHSFLSYTDKFQWRPRACSLGYIRFLHMK